MILYTVDLVLEGLEILYQNCAKFEVHRIHNSTGSPWWQSARGNITVPASYQKLFITVIGC